MGLPGRLANASVAYAVLAPALSVASAATGMMIPMMLPPVEFGAYTMLVGVFQVCVVFDFGLGQLMDRRLAGCKANHPEAWARAARLLWLRLGAGLVLLALATVALAAAGPADPSGLMAAFAGLSFMVANGLVSFYRAGFRFREFVAAALFLQVGLIVPRLAGIVVAGSLGCFAALALWYGFAAAGLVRMLAPVRAAIPSVAEAARIIADSLPLFASTLLWSLYLTSNRWLSALVSTPEELGYLSFGANLAFLLVGSVATVAQVYYPRISRQVIAGTIRPRRIVADMAALAALVGVAVAVVQAALAPVAAQIFPAFVPAIAASRLMLVSAVPLAVVACILPLLLAVSRTSWADCLSMFGLAFPALAAGVVTGGGIGGIAGQSAGCLPGASVLLAVLLLRLERAGSLTIPTAALVFLAATTVAGAALALALHLNP